jgi:predicted TIM-barrel fold metal-dependent hydrolase
MTTVHQAPRTAPGRDESARVDVKLVDTDVHPMLTSPAELKPFLAERWHHYLRHHTVVPISIAAINHGTRVDARPEDGRPAGSDPELMERQLLGEAGVDFAILVWHTWGPLANPEADAAWTAAFNDWQASTWLGDHNAHGRYFGSIRIPAQNPDAAIREIERYADDPRFVQLLLVHPYQPAFGHPSYEPIWRAAAEAGLPVAVHVSVGQLGATQFMHPCGHPAFMFEWHTTSYPAAYSAHVASLVCSGVFERIPDLRFVMLEGGISWAWALGNHLDRNWRLLRSEVPALRHKPSDYIRRHVWFSTQPVEEAFTGPEPVLQAWEQLDAARRIMFSSDYPHWDFDDPKRALPRMAPDLRRRIMADTAIELYDLPRDRPADR